MKNRYSESVQFSSVAQSRPTLCNPMNCSTLGLPVHHQLPESTQTHVHRIGGAIQPSHPLSSPSPPALSLSQHQGLFQWVSSSHQAAKVLEFQLQHQSFRFRILWVKSKFWLDFSLSFKKSSNNLLTNRRTRIMYVWLYSAISLVQNKFQGCYFQESSTFALNRFGSIENMIQNVGQGVCHLLIIDINHSGRRSLACILN